MAGGFCLGLLGDPVAHSLSPRFQTAALRALGLSGSYEAIRVPAGELAERLAELAADGFTGLNVTVPLKEEAFALLAGDPVSAARLSPVARALAAVNTLHRTGGAWTGHNTDPEGFRRAAAELGATLAGCQAVLLGAGGAARAALWALLEAGAERVALWNRSPGRRDRLLADFATHPAGAALSALPTGMAVCPPEATLVVQATSLGLAPDDPLPPLPDPGTRPRCLDLVTHPSPWQRACLDAGCETADGRAMLLWQGAAAFTIWTERPAPVAAMRATLYPD